MARVKRSFWCLLLRYEPFHLGASEFGTMYFPYRYEVQGYRLMDCAPHDGGRKWTGLKYFSEHFQLEFFVYRNVDRKWHLHEVSSGGFCFAADTIDNAVAGFHFELSELARLRKAKKTQDPHFAVQVTRLGDIMRRPVISTEEALKLLDRPRQHKLAEARKKKLAKRDLDSRLGMTRADEHYEPRPG